MELVNPWLIIRECPLFGGDFSLSLPCKWTGGQHGPCLFQRKGLAFLFVYPTWFLTAHVPLGSRTETAGCGSKKCRQTQALTIRGFLDASLGHKVWLGLQIIATSRSGFATAPMMKVTCLGTLLLGRRFVCRNT